MSEVKSARVTVDDWAVDNTCTAHDVNDDLYDALEPGWVSSLCELIESDRRAIIEKCKDLIMLGSEPHTMIRCAYACSLLDSVLSEIEKEE